MPRALILVLAIFLIAVRGTCRAEDSGLSVSIVIPHTDAGLGELRWSAGPPAPHFHVLLQNTTAAPKRIFQEWNSWGYYALSFELTNESGETTLVHKGVHGWTKNGPSYWTIAPNDFAIIDVYFADRSTWGDGFWLKPGNPTGRVKLRAIYQVSPDENSKNLSVWTGKITSPPVECFIK